MGVRLKPPKGYKVIIQEMYASDDNGSMQYLKAIKIGGVDYSQTTEKNSS